jgi:hypothetical protein
MPFKLGTKTIQLDTPFTHNDIQYPANWIRLASEADKSAIGLVWEADAVRADDRFYWDGNINNPKALEDKLEVDQDGNPMYVKVLDNTDPQNPVMVDSAERLVTKGLKSQNIAQVKQTAGSLLAQTDWMVIRKAERNVDIPAGVVTYRAGVVAECERLEAAIAAVSDIDGLIAVQADWPKA